MLDQAFPLALLILVENLPQLLLEPGELLLKLRLYGGVYFGETVDPLLEDGLQLLPLVLAEIEPVRQAPCRTFCQPLVGLGR